MTTQREKQENSFVFRFLMRLQEHELRSMGKFRFLSFFAQNAEHNRKALLEVATNGKPHDQATAKRILELLKNK